MKKLLVALIMIAAFQAPVSAQTIGQIAYVNAILTTQEDVKPVVKYEKKKKEEAPSPLLGLVSVLSGVLIFGFYIHMIRTIQPSE